MNKMNKMIIIILIKLIKNLMTIVIKFKIYGKNWLRFKKKTNRNKIHILLIMVIKVII